MTVSISVPGRRDERLQVSRKNSVLHPGFGPLLFRARPCLRLFGKAHGLLQCSARSKGLLSYTWLHLFHSYPVNEVSLSLDEVTGSPKSEIPTLLC